MDELKVAVTVNENYVYPLKVMLYSLFTTQKERIKLFLIHKSIDKDIIMKLKDYCSSYNAVFQEIRIENDAFENAPVMGHLTKDMYYRLFLPWLLPKEDKVLYLDPDIIINGSLNSLWNMDIEKISVAAVKDRLIMTLRTKTVLELKKGNDYINSGVLLFNLKKIRSENSQEEIISLLSENEKELVCPDQDLINLLWEDKIKRIGYAYNFNPNFLFLKEHIIMPFIKHPWKIIHYMGPDKPWNKFYKGNVYMPWAKAEWHVYPEKRPHILYMVILGPYRYVYGFYDFIKKHSGNKKGKK